MKTFLYLIYALDASFLPLIYNFLCFLREIRDEFCTRGKGKAANMAKFYIWKVLNSQVAFLREISAILPDDVTGSTSSSSEDATPTRISKRDSNKLQEMAAEKWPISTLSVSGITKLGFSYIKATCIGATVVGRKIQHVLRLYNCLISTLLVSLKYLGLITNLISALYWQKI